MPAVSTASAPAHISRFVGCFTSCTCCHAVVAVTSPAVRDAIILQLLQEISLLKESIKERDAALLDLRMENTDLQLKADQVPPGCVH